MPKYELDYSKAEYQCPDCGSGQGLWQAVSFEGWVSATISVEFVGEQARPAVVLETTDHGFQGTDWDIEGRITHNHGGCGECGWEGGFPEGLKLHAPRKLGWDGRPIRAQMEGQLGLLDA
jgi:hypothetical protein